MIPDDDEYVRILAKQVASLTIRSNWEGEQDDRTDRAARCLEGYLATDWEGCVDCDEVQDCIENDEGVQDAIIDILNANTDFPVQYPPMQMLPSERLTQDLSSAYNPECDYDVLFGQCYGVVDLIDASIVDVNQKLETATNVGELAGGIISTIPVLAGLVKIIGIDGALSLLNYFQEVVSEGYDAQYTTTPGGTRDQIACALFCYCKVDCVITIERITQVMADRLAVYQAPPSLTGFIDLVETLAGINVDTTYVVDSAFYAAVGLMVTGNYLFGGVADNVIDLVIALASDEPSNDWILLCECAGDWAHEIRFDGADMPDGWTVPAGIGTHVPGEGILADAASGGTLTARARFDPASGFTVTGWVTEFSPVPVGSFSQIFSPYTTGASYTFNFVTLPADADNQSATGFPATFSNDPFDVGIVFNADPFTGYLKAVIIAGTGTDPFV